MVKPKETSEWLKILANCEKILPDEEVNALGKINSIIEDVERNVTSEDEVDEDLEAESQRLNEIPGLPTETYSLTRIIPNLPECVKYGVRSGLTHMNMHKFSSYSRGLQGPAIAIAAYATSGVIKTCNWNEPVIDQIIEDGDTYFCESYKHRVTSDRRLLGVDDLNRTLSVQKTHQVDLLIDDAAYVGVFCTKKPTEMHVAKALELFFQNYDAVLLTSSRLNISIWRDGKGFNIFDGQSRRDDLLPDDSRGYAKLMLLDDFTGVLFIILEKSNVMNEHYVLYPLNIIGVSRNIEDDHSEPAKFIGEPQRRTSGYNIQGLRALVRGTFHMMHDSVPEMIRGHTHLIVALIAIVYSRLIPANKWNTAIVDLIFNQAHIYFVDLVRVIDKQFDENFSLNIDDLLGDVFLGVYIAKVQVEPNVIPGNGKKGKGKGKGRGKVTLQSGLLEFFEKHQSAILEVKKVFYAIWKDGDKYYFLDPFACDKKGFRVDSTDIDLTDEYKSATSCVTMNSTIDEVIETILVNTDNTEKDPFILHGIQILYVKTGNYSQGLPDTVIYRGEKTNRRPLPPLSPSAPEQLDQYEIKVDTTPKPRTHADKRESKATQYPELFKDIDDYMMKDNDLVTHNDVEIQQFSRYNIINPHRIILFGKKNCLDLDIESYVRGQQGLSMALTAIAQSKLKHPSKWRSPNIDMIIDVGNKMHYNLANLKIREPTDEDDDDDDEEDEEDEEDDDEGDDDNDEEDEEGDDDDEEDDEEDDKDDEVDNDEENYDGSFKIDKLPDRIKFGDNNIELQHKVSMMEGVADPLVNLGEALDHYFAHYNELILENRHLMYGIWKVDSNYLIFNPYGSDADGWRWRNYPASLTVIDSLRELVDLLHGILDYNDRTFQIHLIHIQLNEPRKNITKTVIDLSESKTKKYQTLFLPLTDDDLADLNVSNKEQDKTPKVDIKESESEDDDEETGDGDNDENLDETESKKVEPIENITKMTGEKGTELTVVNPFIESEEIERPDAPSQLNLFLITANVNLVDEKADAAAKEALEYERLKYNQPPPYVLPPKRVLATLLTAKKASKSISSLISRFSIDSKLEVKIDFSLDEKANLPTINNIDDQETSKKIELPPKKYFYSRVLPTGFTPLRAVNEKFIHEKNEKECDDEDSRKNSKPPTGIFNIEEVPELFEGIRIPPTILPLGPLIKTPLPIIRPKPCVEKKKRRCKLSAAEQKDEVLKKLVCNTEEVLFDLIFSPLKSSNEQKHELQPRSAQESIAGQYVDNENSVDLGHDGGEEIDDVELPPESVGFRETDEGNGIISANMKLEDRPIAVENHIKCCYFASILCILAKTKVPVDKFHSTLLDRLLVLANKYFERTGSLRYKLRRKFKNIELSGVSFDIILKQEVYADPENHELDTLPNVLEKYLTKFLSGIMVFENASYAFWQGKDDRYYLFDPYGCDEMGHGDDIGNACLLRFSNMNNLITKIEHHSVVAIDRPFRIHSLSISHIDKVQRRKLRMKSRQFKGGIDGKVENTEVEEEAEEGKAAEDEEKMLSEETKLTSEKKASLIELSNWLEDKNKIPYEFNINIPGFAPLTDANASVLEVTVIENDITRPILAPFKSNVETVEKNSESPLELPRRKPFDRKFNEHSILGEPLDLCIMAWSCIHEPTVWGVRTIRGIYDASQDLAYDSLLSAEDTTVGNMIDGVLNEFDIANYRFHVIFAPIHIGKLYSKEGWNLAMSVKRVFDTPIYTGALISCGKAHIGIMKKDENCYAWWGVVRTKNFRIITSRVMEDFLKLIIQEIDESKEVEFKMRVITISYAKKLDPDCTDTKGLHEPTAVTSLPHIYRKKAPNYDVKALFRSTIPNSKPIFILGTVALQQCELVKEPLVKRCYFIAILAVMVKRDIMQSLMPSMIDKIMQVGEELYREFKSPKYHTEHILRNVTVMNRIFDFRDIVSPLYKFKQDIATVTDDDYSLVLKKLQNHFKKHSHGILHFTNCCYGFWYSQSTTFYYYVDPYPCNDQGKRVLKNGNGCLGIFSSLDQMVKSIMLKRAPNTTGFFIHNIHIESINVAPSKLFVEDPMWIYLDYHWCAIHALSNTRNRHKKKHIQSNESDDQHHETKKLDRSTWNHYTIEIPDLIYSIWGTLGAYDSRFGTRAGKNQAAICVAVLAMQHLCHPSKWNAAILDSAVICGDCYYTESLKSAARHGTEHSNKFNLQTCFRVFPHGWKIEYGEMKCGILYGADNRTTLAATLKLALEKSSNVLINCENITVAVVFAGDGYYAADPCWTGPPLFLRNHGALYVLRCRNLNSLVYALTKMINTNLRLEFTVTPVEFSFKHEVCIGVNLKKRKTKKRILSDTVECRPSAVMTPREAVRGAIAVPDNDVYLEYRENVGVGIECGSFLENPSIPSPVPQLDEEIMRHLMISTEWHKSIGKVTQREHSQSPMDPRIVQHTPKNCYIKSAVNQEIPSIPSVVDVLQIHDDYPRTVDFLDDKCIVKSMKPLTQRHVVPELPPKKPLDCLPPRDFILLRSEKEFERQINDMANDSHKVYEHKTDGDNDDDNDDDDVNDDDDANDDDNDDNDDDDESSREISENGEE